VPALNWANFKSLSGDVRINFENLCRGIVRSQFGRYGKFKALKNQPGVEYHIDLTEDCDALGDKSRWFGWQCKWFELNQDKSLKASSKADIVDSLNKTVRHVPDLTDWVLWTPFTLSKKDQVWFEGLESKYNFALHLWAEEEIDNWLYGSVLMLRKTYFEELILTPENLEQQHKIAIQPIKDRWLIPVHQEVSAERKIKQMLAFPTAWENMLEIGERLALYLAHIKQFEDKLAPFNNDYQSFLDVSQNFSYVLQHFHDLLIDGDLDIIHQWLIDKDLIVTPQFTAFPRLLRKHKLSIALEATNVIDDIRIANELFDSVKRQLTTGVVAILADAGGGKTQLSAQISSTNEKGLCGVFIQGKKFTRHSSLDDLARNYKINGVAVNTFDCLLAAVDSAAKRAKCRLAIVIDGLNEAEDPRCWKDPLAQLMEQIKEYPNVLVVCTLRTGELSRGYNFRYQNVDQRESFAIAALPESIRRIESNGFGDNTVEAIHSYLHYFKINSGDTEFPVSFFKRPLTLRIYCEATNPDRKHEVKVDYFPSSLPPLFAKYLQNSCRRIESMTNLQRSYRVDDIENALFYLGQELWASGSREFDEKTYRDLISDVNEWESSIVNLLAQEGIIFRNLGDLPSSYTITPVYDALGGYLIADYLLRCNPNDRELNWFENEDVIKAFFGDESHHLSSDIFRSLVSLVPSKFYGTQLWKVVPEEFKENALLLITELEGAQIDGDSIKALVKLYESKPNIRASLYKRIKATRSSAPHPINADFLTMLLNSMTMAERDLYWTEWIRKNHDAAIEDINCLTNDWQNNLKKRTESDVLKAKWVMWFLTSTSHRLRDNVTSALYWFGRGDESTLFNLCLFSSEINDAYVFERVLAASYGVAIDGVIGVDKTDESEAKVFSFAKKLFDLFFVDGKNGYTTHIKIRDYCSRIIELANYCNPSLFNESEIAISKTPYTLKDPISWQKMDEIEKVDNPFFMDFENKTIGRLIPSRREYDFDHDGYKEVKAQLMWRVHDLGWSGKNFKEIDEQISSSHSYRRMGIEKNKVDRYGKKYSWIAYHEMTGKLCDEEELECWWLRSSSDIDISFLTEAASEYLVKEDLLSLDVKSDDEWIKTEVPPPMGKYLEYSPEANENWILLDGVADRDDKIIGRKIFCVVKGYFIKKEDFPRISEKFSKQEFSSHILPEITENHDISFREISWSNSNIDEGSSQFTFENGEETVFIKQPVMNVVQSKSGIKINFSDDEERPITRPRDEYIDCYIPVCSISMDIGDETKGSLKVISKGVIDKFGLRTKSQSLNMYTPDGEMAACLLGNNKNSYSNFDSFLYLRKDLLDEYLTSNNRVLVWVTWGERSLSSNGDEVSSRQPQYSIYNEFKVYTVK